MCVSVHLCVCVRLGETHGAAAQSRSVKLEWTPGPRLALIAFLSTSSSCIRVTFPLRGTFFSFIYLFILFSMAAQTCRLHPCSNFTEVALRGYLQKRSSTKGKFQQPSVLLTLASIHLWLCFALRQWIMDAPLFVRLFHYLPPPFARPPGPSDAIYHPRETLHPLQLENLMNK